MSDYKEQEELSELLFELLDTIAQAYTDCRQGEHRKAAGDLALPLGAHGLLREDGSVNWQALDVLTSVPQSAVRAAARSGRS